MRPCRREGHCGQAVVGNDGSVNLLMDEVRSHSEFPKRQI